MRRRTFVAALPAAAGLTGLTGCLGDSDGAESPDRTGSPAPESGSTRPEPTGTADGDPSTTDTPTTGGSTPGGLTTSAHTVRVRFRAAYRHVINVDGIRVVAPEADQFAFVHPPPTDGNSSPDGNPPPDAFALALGDRRIAPTTFPRRYRSWTPGIESVYVPAARDGWLVFDVPVVEANETNDAALVFDGTRYPMPDEARSRLARAPELTLESVSVPESVRDGERIELGVTAANDGDREGLFLAGFRFSGLPKTIEVQVPPGETRSAAVTYESHGAGGSMHFDFDYPGGDDGYEVEILPGTTADAG